MTVTHSLPSIDISPLRKECFAELPQFKVDENFCHEVLELSKSLEWYTARLNHREYGESKTRPDFTGSNPFGIDHTKIDHRIITRQLQSSIKIQNDLAIIGNIHSGKNNVLNQLKKMLGPCAKHFNDALLFRFDSDQSLIPHKDGGGGCRLYIPIHPVGMQYSRLEMYYDNDIYYVYNLDNPPKVCLFSQEVPHAVFNHGYPQRYNLQIATDLSYKELLKELDLYADTSK